MTIHELREWLTAVMSLNDSVWIYAGLFIFAVVWGNCIFRNQTEAEEKESRESRLEALREREVRAVESLMHRHSTKDRQHSDRE